MAVNVPEPRHGNVFSDHVLQEIVNGVNGVNVVLHVDQENKTEIFCNKPNLVGGSVLETTQRNVTSKNALDVNGVYGVDAVHPVDQENKPESSLVEQSVLKR
jgi:hypothetical protein